MLSAKLMNTNLKDKILVLNAGGLTGIPNVDWCEDHKSEVIKVNVCGTLNLADVCESKVIHCMMFATGCIFEYDDSHLMGSGIGFTEKDAPNFTGSYYSKTKGMVESLLRDYKKNVYREYVDPNLTYTNFSLDEQAKILKAGRSNNELDATKLKKEFPKMLSIRDSCIKFVFEPAKAKLN